MRRLSSQYLKCLLEHALPQHHSRVVSGSESCMRCKSLLSDFSVTYLPSSWFLSTFTHGVTQPEPVLVLISSLYEPGLFVDQPQAYAAK